MPKNYQKNYNLRCSVGCHEDNEPTNILKCARGAILLDSPCSFGIPLHYQNYTIKKTEQPSGSYCRNKNPSERRQ